MEVPIKRAGLHLDVMGFFRAVRREVVAVIPVGSRAGAVLRRRGRRVQKHKRTQAPRTGPSVATLPSCPKIQTNSRSDPKWPRIGLFSGACAVCCWWCVRIPLQ